MSERLNDMRVYMCSTKKMKDSDSSALLREYVGISSNKNALEYKKKYIIYVNMCCYTYCNSQRGFGENFEIYRQ